MNHNAAEFYQSWPGKMGAMKAHAPDIGRSFSAMFQSLMKDSAA